MKRRELDTLLRDVAVLDFESLGIEGRPRYPPSPVGLAVHDRLRPPKQRSEYLAFGHLQGGNNSSWEAVRGRLGQYFDSGRPIMCHNTKFDLALCAEHFELELPPATLCHDTLPALYLDDPRAPSLSLKPSAERILEEPPEEQDAVYDWLISHQPVPGLRLTKKTAGAFIAHAPTDLVGTYAIGDVERTWRLAAKLFPSIIEREMWVPYLRELRMTRVVQDMEPQGVRVDVKRLERDVGRGLETLERLDAWLRKRLKAPGLNVDSDEEMVEGLVVAKLADPKKMLVTATGKLSANKDSLALGVSDKQVLHALKYRTQLATCVRTFMSPWLAVAVQSGGLIYTQWNTTRSTEGGGAFGTRTGRLSSTPNFQNIPNEFQPLWAHEDPKRKDLPKAPFELMPLPLVRGYIIPYEDGHALFGRDYSQQELRILGHYEGGALLDAYVDNPWLDVHDNAQEKLAAAGKVYDRKPVKNTNFGLIYGMGVGKLALKNNLTVDAARDLKNAILAIYPGLKGLYKDMKERMKSQTPIRTWGGREYYCEEARVINGRTVEFDYKMLNLLVQGSAADCTKEAMIRYYERKPKHHRLVMQVHDELLGSAPRRELRAAMALLQECMESVEFDVPMLSDGFWSTDNWSDAALADYDKKGVVLYEGH